MDDAARKAIETLVRVVNELAGPGVYVYTDDTMTRDEIELELLAGFLKEGHSPEAAEKKAGEFLQLIELMKVRSNISS